MQIKKLVEFQKRQVKNKRKGKKSDDMDGNKTNGSGGKQKKRSHFDEELTDVKKARTFRHQPKNFPGGKNEGRPPTSGGKKFFGGSKSDKPKSDKFNKGGGGAKRFSNGNANKSHRKFDQKMGRKKAK